MDRLNRLFRSLPGWSFYALGTLPFLWVFGGALTGRFGPDPVKGLEHGLGEWGLRILIASLAITPLRRHLGLNLLKHRRAIGLVGFFYVLAHFATWLALDMAFYWSQIAADLVKRPYILVGFAGFVALVPLAVTSNNLSLRRLGGALWRRVHRLAYPAILLGAVHFVMIGKVWTAESLIYLALVGGLLALRLPWPKRTGPKMA